MGVISTTITTLRNPHEIYDRITADSKYVNTILIQAVIGIFVFSAIYGFLYGIAAGGNLNWAVQNLIRFPAVFFVTFLMSLLPFGFIIAFFNIPWNMKQSAAVIGNILMVTCVFATSFAFFILLGSVASEGFDPFVSWVNYFIIAGSLGASAVSFGKEAKTAFKLESGAFIFLLFILIIAALLLASIAFGPFSGADYTPRAKALISGVTWI